MRSATLGILASSFDPFPHPGHVFAMEQALLAGKCEGILAAIHRDPTIERPTKRKPVLTVEERRTLLCAIRYVDCVIDYGSEVELAEQMSWRRPVVRIVGEDHRGEPCTGDDLGIPIFWAKRRPDWSGTEFNRRIVERGVVDAMRRLGACDG